MVNIAQFNVDLFDMLIITALLVGGTWYLYNKKQKEKKRAEELKRLQTVKKKSVKTNILEKMKETNKNMAVFYGSQTGTAEDFALRFTKEANTKYQRNCICFNPESVNMNDLEAFSSEHLAVFFLATYGEGEPTDNCLAFYNQLSSFVELPEDERPDYTNLKYCVFGLGNKTYEHYNGFCRDVDKKLAMLGATRIGERGEGDDDANLEEDFNSWKKKIWPSICTFYGQDFEMFQSLANLENYLSEYIIKEHKIGEIAENDIFRGEHSTKQRLRANPPIFDAKNPFKGTIVTTKELITPIQDEGELTRHCLHAEVEITGSSFTYECGDHIAIWPENSEVEVLRLAKVLGLLEEIEVPVIDQDGQDSGKRKMLKIDRIVSVLPTDDTGKVPIPTPCSYRTILTHYLEIGYFPSLNFLELLGTIFKGDKAKEFINGLLNNKELYQKTIKDGCMIPAELIETLITMQGQHVTVPMEMIIEGLPFKQCRYYSISSSPKVTPNTVHVTAAVVAWKTSSSRIGKGVCTSYLQQLHQEISSNFSKKVQVQCHIRHSHFRLPKPQLPVIMIGPGTGVAPFRGFIQQRMWLKTQGEEVGRTILYFGCRRRDEDFLYKEELTSFQNQGLELHTAFSRETDKKHYVQHVLLEHKEDLFKLLFHDNAYIYICGDAKNMARDVNTTIEKIIETCGASEGIRNLKEASKYVKKLKTEGRFLEDVWS